MRESSVRVGIIIVIVSIIIYYLKNQRIMNDFLNRIIKTKFSKIIYMFFLCFIVIVVYNCGKNVYSKFDLYKTDIENKKMFEICDEKSRIELNKYKELIDINYENQKYNEPYLLDGFSYVDGEWNTGYIIQDGNENQFVWVPCTNLDNKSVPKLEKRYYSNKELISKDYCYDIYYEDFLKSALENGGFYISRYEIGNENDKPVSKKNVKVWNNIAPENAIEVSKNMYNNESFNSELINGFAYDTVYEWIGNTNINNLDNKEEYLTGRKDYNNIFDLYDNLLEITAEKNYDTFVTRGLYDENLLDNYDYIFDNATNRYSILEDESNNYTTFRTILYKK